MKSKKLFTRRIVMNKKNDALAVEEVQKVKTTRLATKPVPTEKQPGCCMGTKDCATTADAATHHHKSPTAATYSTSSEHKKGPKTRITVKYDIGFGNYLFLRGKGANLCWDKGVVLKNARNDEWVWETDLPFSSCEFKVLVNDTTYEIGDNHTLTCGASIQYTPRF
jgi:hypothetical protein